jgi:hypothetical protein
MCCHPHSTGLGKECNSLFFSSLLHITPCSFTFLFRPSYSLLTHTSVSYLSTWHCDPPS